MANPEHLKILKQGVEVWNQWREDRGDLLPDFRSADLQGADLQGAALKSALMHQSKLRGADLRGADLHGAQLKDASLLRANLQGVSLWRANLMGADLRGANLRHGHLLGANFAGARIDGADFQRSVLNGAKFWRQLFDIDLRQAEMGSTVVGDIDLSRATNLHEVRHRAPLIIGVDTLERTAEGLTSDCSRAAEVNVFLREAGVSEEYLELFRSRVGEQAEFFSAFISYSHADQNFARPLYDSLQARCVRCWLGEHDMKPGDRILDVVNDAIRLHDRILLCCSETSLNSWWVKDEIEKALKRERTEDRDIIIPLNLDGYLLDEWDDGLATSIQSRLAADFTGWQQDNAKFEEQFERVVRALRTDEGAREKGWGPSL
ncbi:MAG: toll/interleukin-1 receptor domain-containing protein [bacterium]|nr:toll/interleukin-1 receptor domain-containing protein [bacterium]